GLGIDEALDQPRRRDTVDVRTWPGDPTPPAELGEIEAGSRFGAPRFGTSGAHGNGLLEPPDLGAPGGVEEVDVREPLVILGAAEELVRGRGDHCFLVRVLGDLAVAKGGLAEVAIARLVKEPQHTPRAHILDLLDPDQRRVAAVPLALLGEPLEILVAVRGVG